MKTQRGQGAAAVPTTLVQIPQDDDDAASDSLSDSGSDNEQLPDVATSAAKRLTLWEKHALLAAERSMIMTKLEDELGLGKIGAEHYLTAFALVYSTPVLGRVTTESAVLLPTKAWFAQPLCVCVCLDLAA